MKILIVYDKCPGCGWTFDSHLLGLTSLLGPEAVYCSGCRIAIQTGRAEWPDLNLRGKVRYLSLSVIYAAVVGFLGGYSYAAAHDFWLRIPFEPDEPPDFLGPVFVTGFALWAGGTFLLQGYRVLMSVWRSRRPTGKPSRWFFNFKRYVQFKFILLLLAIPFAIWLVRKAEVWLPLVRRS
jgi:hypothetical protein